MPIWVLKRQAPVAPVRGAMRTTLVIDDHQLASARELSGIRETNAIVREALNALIERESTRRLARLGGSKPDLVPVPRRRTRGA